MTSKTPFDFDFHKVVADFKLPGVDMEALVASQKKNIDALTHANKVAYEGFQALVKRQTEIVRDVMETVSSSAHKVKDAESPAAKLSTQAELAKEAFEHGLANAKELADLVTKSNGEVIGLLNARFTQSLDEFKTLVGKTVAASHAVVEAHAETAHNPVAPVAPVAPVVEAVAVAVPDAEAVASKATVKPRKVAAK